MLVDDYIRKAWKGVPEKFYFAQLKQLTRLGIVTKKFKRGLPMCMAVFKKCECGSRSVQFHLRDNVLPPEVLTRLFCPDCPGGQGFDAASMVNDNGWIIEYDMVLATMQLLQVRMVDREMVQPGYIFDQGYATWLETYPGEREDIREARERLIALKGSNQQRYLQEMISWNIERLAELKAQGWRKAQAA